jgi:hypothetical protein
MSTPERCTERRRNTLIQLAAATLAALAAATLPAATLPAAAQSVGAGAAPNGSGTSSGVSTGTGTDSGTGQLQSLQKMPVNICQNSSLPRDYGTNFPTPSDPYGFGYANQTVIGWEGNYYAPFAYLSGSYFARGVPLTYQRGGTGTT